MIFIFALSLQIRVSFAIVLLCSRCLILLPLSEDEGLTE